MPTKVLNEFHFSWIKKCINSSQVFLQYAWYFQKDGVEHSFVSPRLIPFLPIPLFLFHCCHVTSQVACDINKSWAI